MTPRKLLIFSDFDGTISTQDGLTLLLDKFANPSWWELERAIREKKMTEREALPKMMHLMRISPKQAKDFVFSHLQIDPHFKEFVLWAEGVGASIKILSGGFVDFIDTVLKREGISHLEVQANSWNKEIDQWEVIPYSTRLCEEQCHCKCAALPAKRSEENFVIYIGDGHTDLCPAKKVDLVFAKDFLLEFCKTHQMNFYAFENFSDIQRQLANFLFKIDTGLRAERT